MAAAVRAWVQAIPVAVREGAAAQVGAVALAALAAVFGKQASHPRQAEDQFHPLAEAEPAALVPERARVVVPEAQAAGREAAAALAPVMAVAGRAQERGLAEALEQVGRAAEVARVQAPVGVAEEERALEQGLVVAVPAKSRASGLLRLRCCVEASLAVCQARWAEAVV